MVLINAEMQEGFVILVVGMGIVFLSLILLHLVFTYAVPKIISVGGKKKEKPVSTAEKTRVQSSGEEMAAVAAAIYMFLEETHDEENAILTIHKSSKSYSPWSSKIYSTHHFARR